MVLLDSILIALILLNFYLIGSSRMNAIVSMVGVQGLLLGLLPLIVAEHLGLETVITSLLAATIKGFVLPYFLFRAIREVHIRRDVAPVVGYVPTLLMGAVGTAAAIIFSRTLPLIDDYSSSLLVPAALSTVLTGFILLATRAKAITQVVGFLVLENGVFLFGITLVHAMPFVVELGSLLDLFVGVFIMGIILNHIRRTFSSLDTMRMTALRD
jgi:hydrogenase-4 component E